MKTEKTSEYYKEWYAKNRVKVAAARKKRYESDPEYRQKVQEQAATARAARKALKPDMPGKSIAEVCELLGVKNWTLHNWRAKGYYPTPALHGGRPYFLPHQVALLKNIRGFFEAYPNRNAGIHKDKLDAIVDVIHLNWSE